MTPEQVVDLLTLIAARDRRTIGKTDVTVWAFDIGDLDYDDACRAVADHFREAASPSARPALREAAR
jgi:hypothetical protein